LPAGGAGVNAPTFAAHLRLGEELEMVTTPGAHEMSACGAAKNRYFLLPSFLFAFFSNFPYVELYQKR
jgi:hypothetical protein